MYMPIHFEGPNKSDTDMQMLEFVKYKDGYHSRSSRQVLSGPSGVFGAYIFVG
jgi:hypothetical protein